ncbi:MAG: hypothetical protein IPO79_13880 [Flavobacteriales bacterium]|nr:hypothetical protein [Flavobacteriales bacterium]
MLPAITHRIVLFLLVLLLLTQAQGQRWGGHVAARIQALQDRGVAFTHVGLVQELQVDDRTTARWQEATARATVLSLHAEAVTQVLRGAAHTMAVTLPTPDGPLTLELERWQPLADGFTVTTALRGAMQVEPGVHYRGRVRGEAASVAGLSVFDDELIGVVRDAQGTLVLGRLNGAEAGMHVVYREHDLRLHRPMTCGTTHDGDPYHASELQGDPDDRSIRCVKFYWEVDHPIFVDKGGVVAATNYVTGLFNQSAILFDNDGVDVQLQEVFVWDVTSPYTGPSTSNYLNQFGAYRTSFNGDLAHLLGYSGNGGIAWINSLCGGTSSRMAYSDINSSYSNVPTYSWSVEVVTHEQGHNLGSAHTHACVWNGNGTAIDGCGPTAGYTEGSCATGPLPTGGGTIMSYCHLVGGVGINFTNGFGPQPAAVIRNRVNASACLAQCGSTCDPPGTLSVTNLTSNAATLSWSNLGVAAYTLRWKPQVAPHMDHHPGADHHDLCAYGAQPDDRVRVPSAERLRSVHVRVQREHRVHHAGALPGCVGAERDLRHCGTGGASSEHQRVDRHHIGRRSLWVQHRGHEHDHHLPVRAAGELQCAAARIRRESAGLGAEQRYEQRVHQLCECGGRGLCGACVRRQWCQRPGGLLQPLDSRPGQHLRSSPEPVGHQHHVQQRHPQLGGGAGRVRVRRAVEGERCTGVDPGHRCHGHQLAVDRPVVGHRASVPGAHGVPGHGGRSRGHIALVAAHQLHHRHTAL